MLRRALVLALVPLLPLPGLAHTHAEHSAHDPSGLDRAPHLHLRFFYDWALAGQPGDSQTDDHDEDAVYFPASVVPGRNVEQSTAVVTAEAAPAPLPAMVACPCPAPAVAAAPVHLPFDHASECPVYLRVRALLI
jgi:hypothetical protein